MIYNINFLLIGLEAFLFKRIRFASSKKSASEPRSGETIYTWREKNRSEKLFLIISFLELVLPLCFRNISVGADTHSYAWIFDLSAKGKWTNVVEPGFNVTTRLLTRISSDHTFLFSAYAVITLFLFYRFIVNHSDDVYMSVIIFASVMLYFQMFNIMRQSLAIAIALQSLSSAINKKWPRFLLIVAVAASIHSSAAAFVIAFLLVKLRVKADMKYFSLIAVLSFAGLAAEKLFLRYIVAVFARQYLWYFESESYSEAGGWLNPIFYLGIMFIICLLSRKNADRTDSLFLNMLGTGTILYIMSTGMTIISRLPYFFTPSLMITVPSVIGSIQNKRTAQMARIGFYVIFTIYEFLLVSRNAHGIMPYKTIWD